MSVKSKHGAGGEYAPHWKPPVSRMSLVPFYYPLPSGSVARYNTFTILFSSHPSPLNRAIDIHLPYITGTNAKLQAPEEVKEEVPAEEGEKEEIPPAKPAWRVVNKRPERKPRPPKGGKAAPTPGTPAAPKTPDVKGAASPPEKNVPSWATWRRMYLCLDHAFST